MVRMTFRLSAVALVALATACTCEVSLGPGADHDAPPTTTVMKSVPAPAPVVTQQASAIDPGLKPGKPPAPAPTGTLSEASVKKTAARHRNELAFCTAQEGTPKAKMQVGFMVLADGSVHEDIEVIDRAEASDKVKACMISALKRWKFEQPKGGPARATLTLKH